MDNSLTITSFQDTQKDRKNRKQGTPYRAVIDLEMRAHNLIQHLDNLIVQHRNQDGPRGYHLGEWRGSLAEDGNLIECHAITLNYELRGAEEVIRRIEELGWATVVVEGEDKDRKLNSVAFHVLCAEPVTNSKTYARVASVLAHQIDAYGLIDGSLSATHVTYVHATSLVGYLRGRLLNVEAFKVRTAKDYQGLDARRYHGGRPIVRQPAQPVVQLVQDETGLFEFAETKAERAARKDRELLASLGCPDLTLFGDQLLPR